VQKIRLISLVLLTLTLTTVQANSLDNGLLAYERGDYVAASELLTPQADAGSALAQFCLGYMNYMGVGVAQNQTQAALWYKKAADQGFADAQYNLGYLYLTGEGVERNVDAAVSLLNTAAKSGHPLAAYELGVLHEFGDGIPLDWNKAKAAYKLAAADGFQLAQQAYRRVTTSPPPASKPAKRPAPTAPVVAAISPASPVAPAASTPRSATYRLKVDRVNLRNGPGSNFDVVDILAKGALLRRLGTQGEWSHLRSASGVGPEGWLVTRFLERMDGSSADPIPRRAVASAPEPAVGNSTIRLFVKSSEANMREAPSINAAIVARLSGGQPLELEGRDGDWVLVEIPVNTGFKGWVHQDLLAWPN
jgi:SH3-like domain-containing protein